MNRKLGVAVLAAAVLGAWGCGEGVEGPAGPQGEPGAPGAPGAPGPVVFGADAGVAVEGNDPRLSDARAPLPGSPSYIQNQAEQPQEASLSIKGSASTGGLRVRTNATFANATCYDNIVPVLSTRDGDRPRDSFRVLSDGSFVADTWLGCGKIPVEGRGQRLMWHSFKAAFRAGSVDAAQWDDAQVGFFSWAGGSNTTASGIYGFAMGQDSVASSQAATALGVGSVASGTASLAAGHLSSASGYGSVALGHRISANADGAVVIGGTASANGNEGSLVLSAAVGGTGLFVSSRPRELAVRATGGVRLVTACTGGSPTVPCAVASGVYVAEGGSGWNSISDRNAKEAFRDEDGEAALAKLSRMRIQSWQYKTQAGGVRHLGPVAQDFRAAFGLGESETTINSVDIDGVNMLAVQALTRRTEAQAKELEALRAELAEMRALLKASAKR